MSHDPLYYEKLDSDFEKFISEYDVSARLDLIFKQLIPHCAISSNISALEVGCGTGRISREISKRPWKLTVNDISERLCKQVADPLGCQYLAGDCRSLPVQDGTFDLIISSECIEHTVDPWGAMKEMTRVLKPGGYLIVTTPNKFWYPILCLANLLKIRKFRGIEHWTWPWAMRQWLSQNGFQNIHFGGCHLFPWQLPLAKSVLPLFDKWGHILYPAMINYGFSAQK